MLFETIKGNRNMALRDRIHHKTTSSSLLPKGGLQEHIANIQAHFQRAGFSIPKAQRDFQTIINHWGRSPDEDQNIALDHILSVINPDDLEQLEGRMNNRHRAQDVVKLYMLKTIQSIADERFKSSFKPSGGTEHFRFQVLNYVLDYVAEHRASTGHQHDVEQDTYSDMLVAVEKGLDRGDCFCLHTDDMAKITSISENQYPGDPYVQNIAKRLLRRPYRSIG